MKPMKTPGVYIVEKSAFPNSVVQVATAVPAFVGYTERAINGNRSLRNVPWRISSMAEFHDYFGFGPSPIFDLVKREAPAGRRAVRAQRRGHRQDRSRCPAPASR